LSMLTSHVQPRPSWPTCPRHRRRRRCSSTCRRAPSRQRIRIRGRARTVCVRRWPARILSRPCRLTIST
jgi:hypothetical protein